MEITLSLTEQIERCNRDIFGNKTLRENQLQIINCTMRKNDVVALIPTGGGKSLTFQLPAAIEQGKVCFVVMPLLSLIKDNSFHVKKIGIPCCVLSAH